MSAREARGDGAHATLVARLPRNAIGQLDTLRTVAGLEVCCETDWIWLRIATPSDADQVRLQGLASAELFWLLSDGQLVRVDARVPRGYLPEGAWCPLQDALVVELPTAALPGTLSEPARFRLCPVTEFREPNILLVSVTCWREYGSVAPRVRLKRWWFAVSAEGNVLVRGTPLPPLPGTRFVESCGIAVPAGHTWTPTVQAEILAGKFGVSENDLLLWMSDDRCELIRAEQFVRATRSAIRRSTAAHA